MYLFPLRRTNHTGQIQSGHEPNRAHRQLSALFHVVISEDADLQASAAQIDNTARSGFRPQGRQHGLAAETGLFRCADYFQKNSGFSLDRAHKRVAIFRLSRSAGRHRSEEHTSELQSRLHLVCRLLLEKKKKENTTDYTYVDITVLNKSDRLYRIVCFLIHTRSRTLHQITVRSNCIA